jgi:hypothetical protein
MTEYEGDEKRQGFCPVHHIKCEELKSIKSEGRKKLPIWVFTFFATILFSAMWWYNIQVSEDHQIVIKSLQMHLTESSIVFRENARVISRATHILSEVAFNQRTVMEKLEMDYQEIPDFDMQ